MKVSLVEYVQANRHDSTTHSQRGHFYLCVIDSQELDGSRLLH